MPSTKHIFKSIGWFKSIFLIGMGGFMLMGGYYGYHIHQVYAHTEAIELSDLDDRFKDGDYVKIKNFKADYKHRVRGLIDKTQAKDLWMLIPLRPPGEEQGDDISFLYLMKEDHYDDSVFKHYETYQESRVDMPAIQELVVEISEIDELRGDVPIGVRANKRVGEKTKILWHTTDDPAWGVFVFFGTAFVLYWLFLYLRHRRRLVKEEGFYN